MMRTGNDNLEERTFNVYQRRFTGVDEFKADVTEKAFGKEETRRGFLNKTIAFMQAGAARNNGGKVTIGGTERNVADMYKGMEKDINRVFINHAVTGRPFSPGKLRDFVMDPNNCDRSYITAITTGVKGNSHDVIEAICAAMFTTDGNLDRQAYNKINLAITENYRQQDSYRQSLAEVAETFGQGQFLSGGLTAKQEADLRETPGLAPCAFLTIWNVRGKYLDMVMVQRSGDMLTASGAGGINEIQYAALLLMVARATGYEAGVFTHFVANEQIYDRHIDNANELLRRADEAGVMAPVSSEGQKVPNLILNKEPGCDISSIAVEDFEMQNYEPMQPQLVFELGI